MKAKMATAAMVLAMAGTAGAEVTVDPTTLELVIPSLNFGGDYYSARLNYAGGCFHPYEVLPVDSGGGGATRVTMTHDGFDFSAGSAPSDWDNTDGYITAWAAISYPAGYEWGSALWFSPYGYASQTGEIYVQDMGAVSLDSVTAAPSDWTYTDGMSDNPLIEGHVYVVRTREGGYAKFQVISVTDMSGVTQDDFDPTIWQAEIDYVYSSSGTF